MTSCSGVSAAPDLTLQLLWRGEFAVTTNHPRTLEDRGGEVRARKQRRRMDASGRLEEILMAFLWQWSAAGYMVVEGNIRTGPGVF